MSKKIINRKKPINENDSYFDGFVTLNQIFKKNHLRYCLIGGMVTAIWGEARYTKDIDFTVFSKNGLGEIANILEKEGFSVEERGYFQLYVRDKKGFLGDIILTRSDFDDWVIQNSIIVPMCGIDVPVCTAEDLILLKLKANRHIDIVDIELVFQHRKDLLDKDYLKSWMHDLKVMEIFEEEFGPFQDWIKK